MLKALKGEHVPLHHWNIYLNLISTGCPWSVKLSLSFIFVNAEVMYTVYYTSFVIGSVVTFSQSTYIVDEDDGPAQPVLILSNPSSTDITVQVTSNDITTTGE